MINRRHSGDLSMKASKKNIAADEEMAGEIEFTTKVVLVKNAIDNLNKPGRSKNKLNRDSTCKDAEELY